MQCYEMLGQVKSGEVSLGQVRPSSANSGQVVTGYSILCLVRTG
jgi:hypothetical protein